MGKQPLHWTLRLVTSPADGETRHPPQGGAQKEQGQGLPQVQEHEGTRQAGVPKARCVGKEAGRRVGSSLQK